MFQQNIDHQDLPSEVFFLRPVQGTTDEKPSWQVQFVTKDGCKRGFPVQAVISNGQGSDQTNCFILSPNKIVPGKDVFISYEDAAYDAVLGDWFPDED